jgi:threonyl-tRNA synthetase
MSASAKTVSVTLPDGSKIEFPGPVAFIDVARRIGPRLAKDAIGAKVDGQMADLSHTLDHDAKVEIILPASADGLEIIRHSASHVMAEAVKRLWPEAKFVIGPTVEDGFYYDIDMEHKLAPEDFVNIEAEMARIIEEDRPFRRRELSLAQALAEPWDEYKLDNMKRSGASVISFYAQGEPGKDFEDVCRGPHLPSTGRIPAYKVTSVAGAYWHGDATSRQFQRLYGTAWASKKDLDAFLVRREEAAKRDHRKLGRELGLFEFMPEAPGQAFWRPKGMTLKNLVVAYLRDMVLGDGYVEIGTPQIMDKSLWERSGHWANYRDKMYVTERDDRTYAIKPMNCPGGLLLYKAGLYSHNDLPLRWAEFGYVHRHESGGEVHGLLRARGFTQDDAHIFCTPAQLVDEVAGCLRQVFRMYGAFGLAVDHVELSTKPEKRIGSDEQWAMAEKALAGALDREKIAHKINVGDGAFYGPKIDFHIRDAIGRTWQLSTIQVDFALPSPERFDLHYVAEDNTRKTPIMIHRAIAGSLERFIGILVEQYAGDFPVWLAPVQARVASLADRHQAAARETAARLTAAGVRVEMDLSNEKVGRKVAEWRNARVPYLLLLGDREAEAGQVAVRSRVKGDEGAAAVEDFIKRVKEESSVGKR